MSGFSVILPFSLFFFTWKYSHLWKEACWRIKWSVKRAILEPFLNLFHCSWFLGASVFTLAFLSGVMNYAVKRSFKLGLLPGYPQICLVCLYKSEKPSLSLGNQAILHIRKETVNWSFRWCFRPLGELCLDKQWWKGAQKSVFDWGCCIPFTRQ